MANCRDFPDGTVLSWSSAKWKLSQVEKEIFDSKDFCRRHVGRNLMMFPERVSLQKAEYLCERVGGQVAVPRNKTENEAMANLAKIFYDRCEAAEQSGKTAWIGMRADIGKDNWQSLNSDRVISYFNWKGGDGGEGDNCAYMFTDPLKLARWGDGLCTNESPVRVCTVCEFPEKKMVFKLRGLCQESRHDRTFVLQTRGQEPRRPFLKGISSSIIEWNSTELTWNLRHLRYTQYAVITDDTKKVYPFGRFEWMMSDRQCTNTVAEKPTTLTITRCSLDQFTCSNGHCITLEKRCDMDIDCEDRSDEYQCKKLKLPSWYDNSLAPAEDIGVPTRVTINVDIIKFDKIVMKDMMFAVMMRVTLEWKDNRVTYFNLRDDIYRNILDDREQASLWLPEVSFDNAKTGSIIPEETDRILVVKEDVRQPNTDEDAVEESKYLGSTNSLRLVRRYYVEYPCEYNLRFFPFDEQTCNMRFKMRTSTKNYVLLVSGKLTYEGLEQLVEFTVLNYTMVDAEPYATRSTKDIVIQFKREYIYHITQAFFMSFILGALAYFTFWIDIHSFADRYMGSLTALLVIASLMSVFRDGLPKTSYYKVIDIWLLFFVITTAINNGVHIMIDHYLRKESNINNRRDSKLLLVAQGQNKVHPVEEERSNKSRITAHGINTFFKYLFPITLVIFLIYIIFHTAFKFGDIEPKHK